MGRLTWLQLRSQAGRTIALLTGILVATTAFTVLTAAARTAQLRTTGTVTAHFRAAYDILVRPRGARSAFEAQTGTVQPNFLSGIYGGITMAQYHEIAKIPGVQVAAPIAMVGYTLLIANIGWPLPAADLARPGRQLYRTSTTWVSEAGTSRITQPASYQYVTPRPLRVGRYSGATREILPGARSALVCPPQGLISPPENPFGPAAQSLNGCWSKADGYGLGSGAPRVSNPGWGVNWVIPVLIAAIDPDAEARLDGLSHAVVSGRYLAENAGDGTAGVLSTFPVLAASGSGMDEYAVSRLQRLATPASPPDLSPAWMKREALLPGRTLATRRTTAQQAYRVLLRILAGKGGHGGRDAVLAYWSVGPVRYRRSGRGGLVPLTVRNRWSVWYTGISTVSMDNEDTQYRVITRHALSSGSYSGPIASPRLVGIFDPARIRAFDPLSEVPLGEYEPVLASPANAASRRALHGGDLLPNQNLGGYVSQPVDLVTTLSALPALQNAGYYGLGVHAADPISAIRVRVAGVAGPDPLSLERIREVAQQIAVRTGLTVDIVAGSSPEPVTIGLPAGKFGQPPLTLTEDWVKKGVAVTILTAVDKSSVVLFVLILVVCALFVANSASAAVRGRHRELGVLACLGWTRPRLFAAVIGELAAVGLAAGLLGAAVALPLTAALGLRASPARAALAVPVAVVVAAVAGLAPAWLATRAAPVQAARPPVLAAGRGHQPGGITGMAAVNVIRTPGRAIVGAVSLAVGISALTVLAAVTFAFHGDVVGSLLGNAVAVQVRGVDYVAVAAAVALGVLAVADVISLGVRERAAELAALRALGWKEFSLSRLVVTEGAIIGLAGAAAGAAAGLGAAAWFAGQQPGRLYVIAAVAVAAGLAVTTAAALLPAQALRRMPAAHLLAEE